MSYYPPPPPDNDDHHYNYQQHPQQPLHHQVNNRENIGWNNDNVLPDYTNMSSKYNSYSQNDMHNNYYNNNGPLNSQRHDNYHHRDDGGGGNNLNHNNPTIIKRAAKRRVKHDLPGPAGNWFRQKKQQKSAAAAVKNRKSINSTALKGNDSGGTTMTALDNGEQKSTVNNKEDITTSSSSSPSSIAKTKPQDEQLFHDHSSDLHECNAWNFMCTTLNRIVPPANLVLQNHTTTTNSAAAAAHTTYKSILRNSIPDNYALLHEIHEGKYDTCHLDKQLYSTDLHVPLLVGYVASVQCHAHSDWTALLVDEMQSVAKYTTNGGINGNGSHNNNVGRGVVCWIEERLVKQHANWIRPGVVWLIEGAKLALFSSLDDDDGEEEDSRNIHHSTNNTNGSSNAEMTTTTVDVSPSTDNSRGGGAIDRMILVGESSMVYAWTPEEASSTFTHQEFSDLMERRCDLGLREEEEELRDDDKEVKDVIKCIDDGMTSTSNARTSVGGSDDNNNGDNVALIVEKETVETVEIVDVDITPAEEAPEVSEQVLEACSAANDNAMHVESQKVCEEPRVGDVEPTGSTIPPVKNLTNPYAKKNLSQVTPYEESTTKSTDARGVSKQDSVKESSVLVQPLPLVKDTVQDQITEKKGLAVENAQNPQSQQIANRPDQHINVDMDNSFDDMLDEDSLDEMPPHNEEGKPENKLEESKRNKNDSFDDMLDEDSLDITPHKAKAGVGGKLDSKTNTPGADSFDDMLDEDSLDVTPLGLKTRTSTPGGDSFDDMLDEDSDDNIEAMFQTTNPQTASGNLFSPSQGASILDKDDLADLGDEEDDDF